jgi:hypothetical protein
VCSDPLVTLRLGCPSCGTEVSGHFRTCRYCRLDDADARILEVFLRGRGNLRDVQSALDVSYPTARARLTDVLVRLGLSAAAERGAEGPAGGAGPLGPGGGPVGRAGVAGPARPARGRPEPARVDDGPATRPGARSATVDLGTVLEDLASGRIGVEQAESLLRGGATSPTGTAGGRP